MAVFFIPHYNPPMRWTSPPYYLLPGFAGLFFVRLFFELWSVWTHTAVSLWVILPVALAVFLGLILLGRQWASSSQISGRLFPLIFLSGYLFYPHLSPKFAFYNLGFVLLLTAVLNWGIEDWGKRPYLHTKIIVGSCLVLGFGLVYRLTLSPDVLPADNGEFQWVAAQAGVLHPPGFPLYTVLANLFTRLIFWDSPAHSIAIFSLMTSSLTLLFVYLIIDEETGSSWWGVTASLALGSATTFWVQATIANIRSLTGLFAIISLYALLKFGRASKENSERWLLTAVFFTSLGVAHHPSLGFFAIIFVGYVLWLDASIVKSWWRVGKLALAMMPGLLTFVYLPLRAQSGAPGSSPSLANWSGFWNHALARGFSGDFFAFTTPSLLFERFLVMRNVLAFQWTPWILAGVALGCAGLILKNKKLAFLLIGSFILHTFITATYRAPQTVEYMLPAYVVAALILGIGMHQLSVKINQPAIKAGLVALLLLSGLSQIEMRWGSLQYLQHSSDTREVVTTILTQAEPDSIILADWHWFTPLRYVQDIDGLRPDVEVRFVSPDGPSYGQTWARRIEQEMTNGRSVIATHFDPEAYQALPTFRPVGEAFQFSKMPIEVVPESMQTVDVKVEDILVQGVRISGETAVIGDRFPVSIAWQSDSEPELKNLYVHVVGFDGLLYAQDDQAIHSTAEGLTISRFWLTLRPGSLPGGYAIYVGSGSERQLIGNITAVAQPFKPVTQNPVNLPVVGEEKTLVGFDWDQTLPSQTRLYLHWQAEDGFYSTTVDNEAISQHSYPQLISGWGRPLTSWAPSPPNQISHYVPFGQQIVWLGGELLSEARPLSPTERHLTRLHFASAQPVLRDTAVSVRLIGFQPDQFQWAWWDLDDSIPAMGGIPTLKWIEQSQVTSPHFLTASEEAVLGQTVGTTLRLYDAFTNRTLPILDERITAQFQWVPMSRSVIR
ncbi:MAG: DUF2723 domain-containing protein [Chloroflexota bacterium]